MAKKDYRLEDLLDFGKYKGKHTSIQDAIYGDIEYVRWLCQNNFLSLDNEAWETYKKQETEMWWE